MNELTIKELCQKYGIGQSELARRFGIPLRTVQQWHSGERKPPDYTVRMIRTILEFEQKTVGVTNTSTLCCDKECAPPYGDIDDCEFYLDGKCTAKVHLQEPFLLKK